MPRQDLQLTIPILAATRAIRRVGSDEKFGSHATQALYHRSCRPNRHSFIDLLRAGRDRPRFPFDFNDTKAAGGISMPLSMQRLGM